MYLVLGFFALITAYFSVVEQKRIAHRDNRRAAQRRKHIPHLDEICFTFEEITREQALFRILAINYKLLVEEDIEPWWEAVCAQKCSRGDGKLLSSNDVQQILENKHHTLEDKGETEEEFQREYKRKQRTFRETAKSFVFYGHEFAGDSAEDWDTTGRSSTRYICCFTPYLFISCSFDTT